MLNGCLFFHPPTTRAAIVCCRYFQSGLISTVLYHGEACRLKAYMVMVTKYVKSKNIKVVDIIIPAIT